MRGGARLIRSHWLFATILAVGVTVRVLTMVAYPPALFFGDSWGYLSTAFSGHFVSLPYLRPVGYSVLIRVLTLPGRDIVQLIALQHLAGLVMGTLVYSALLRSQIARPIAAMAAALVLLDGYAITLEQYVMADTFYSLTLLVAVLLLIWPRLDGSDGARIARGAEGARLAPGAEGARLAPGAGCSGPGPGGRCAPSTAMVGLSGLLLAASALEREVGLWVIPTFIIYLLWTRIERRRLLLFIVVLAVPLGIYAGVMKEKSGVLGLTATSGRTLYSRVAGVANCVGADIPADARKLCETPAQRASHPDAPDWYMFATASPAQRYFNVSRESTAQRARSNHILGSFAKKIILHEPLTYAGSVASDFLYFFTPGATAYNDAVSATSLPTSVGRETIDESVRRRVIPNAHPAVRSPSAVVRAYRGVVHVPRPVLALLALAALIAVILRTAARREILLSAGTAVLLLFGTAATGGFGLRYLLPAVPLLAIGGVLAGRDLAGTARERRMHGGGAPGENSAHGRSAAGARRSGRPGGQHGLSHPTV